MDKSRTLSLFASEEMNSLCKQMQNLSPVYNEIKGICIKDQIALDSGMQVEESILFEENKQLLELLGKRSERIHTRVNEIIDDEKSYNDKAA
jgi:hypothetical protein